MYFVPVLLGPVYRRLLPATAGELGPKYGDDSRD
jgi:hypothetical protein